jgi:hypothetical protein
MRPNPSSNFVAGCRGHDSQLAQTAPEDECVLPLARYSRTGGNPPALSKDCHAPLPIFALSCVVTLHPLALTLSIFVSMA